MSFDPFGYHPDAPPPGGAVPPSSPPGYGPPPDVSRQQARERVQIPGMFLVAVGVLNLLVGLYGGFATLRAVLVPADRLYAEALEAAERFAEVAPNFGRLYQEQVAKATPVEIKQQTVFGAAVPAALWLLTALFVIFGGVRMLAMRSFGLCIFASILAATPCVSPCGCCCMGNLVGLWALVVLLAPDVRMTFQ